MINRKKLSIMSFSSLKTSSLSIDSDCGNDNRDGKFIICDVLIKETIPLFLIKRKERLPIKQRVNLLLQLQLVRYRVFVIFQS